MGLLLGVFGFSAAVVGGLGISTARSSAALFAALQTIGAVALPFASVDKDVFALAVIIAILAWRPTGLIAEKTSQRVDYRMNGPSMLWRWPFWQLPRFTTLHSWRREPSRGRALLVLAAAAIIISARFGVVDRIRASIGSNERTFETAAVAGVLAAALWFHEEHFIILMMTTAFLLMVASLGLTIQFGFAGVLNFAGAAFLGVGCYTAAVVTQYTALPTILTLPLGGLTAALIGSILILPVLRTRGHYAALVTIAFGILFKVFLEVNDTLGGPQGIQVKPIVLLGWNFNSPIVIGDVSASFYFSYLLLALGLLVVSFALVRRLERSWIGLSFDAIRLDEIAAACYGLNLAPGKCSPSLWKFPRWDGRRCLRHVLGFIAPNNFTFGDLLILVSIVLLGGIGNLWAWWLPQPSS